MVLDVSRPTNDAVAPFRVIFFVGLIEYVCEPTNAFGNRFQRSCLGLRSDRRIGDYNVALRPWPYHTAIRMRLMISADVLQFFEFESRVETFVKLISISPIH